MAADGPLGGAQPRWLLDHGHDSLGHQRRDVRVRAARDLHRSVVARARRHERGPALGAESAEAVEVAVLVLLERLQPRERAAYVLREAFDYDYATIATILQASQTNARQLVSRAKKHLASERRAPVSTDQLRALLEAFLAAARSGDLAGLERVLADDVVSVSDGAGMAPRAARRPVSGRSRVSRFVAGFADVFWVDTTCRWLTANGAPAVLVLQHGEPVAVLSIDASVHGIECVRWVMAPDKLAHLSRRPGE